MCVYPGIRRSAYGLRGEGDGWDGWGRGRGVVGGAASAGLRVGS